MNLTVVLVSPIMARIVDRWRKYYLVMLCGLLVALIVLLSATLSMSMDPVTVLIISSAG